MTDLTFTTFLILGAIGHAKTHNTGLKLSGTIQRAHARRTHWPTFPIPAGAILANSALDTAVQQSFHAFPVLPGLRVRQALGARGITSQFSLREPLRILRYTKGIETNETFATTPVLRTGAICCTRVARTALSLHTSFSIGTTGDGTRHHFLAVLSGAFRHNTNAVLTDQCHTVFTGQTRAIRVTRATQSAGVTHFLADANRIHTGHSLRANPLFIITEAIRRTLRARRYSVYYGFCVSIYFAGPENLSLELSYSAAPIDNRAWIDPEVQALAGISDEELARYKQSSDYRAAGGAVPQPDLDGPGPHMVGYPDGAYEVILGTPDEIIWDNSENQPPVEVTD